MELPFTIVFEPPSPSELLTLCRLRATWLAAFLLSLAIGSALCVATVGHAHPGRASAVADVEVRARPAGADVWLDGQQLGRSPLSLRVEPGAHSLAFKTPDGVDASYSVQASVDSGVVLDPLLWRRQPSLLRLRPSLPGATLLDARLLSDGQVALAIGLPARHQLQAWRLEPRNGALTPLLMDLPADHLAVAPDGQQVAYLGYEVGPTWPDGASGAASPRAGLVWLTSSERPQAPIAWRAPLDADEQLRDASWSPRADRLLVVAGGGQQQTSAAARSRLWILDAATLQARELLSLPSDVVPGSAVWSPDGTRVAFLTRAGQLNALCLLDLNENNGFRYLADLEPTSAAPIAYPAAVWSADSQRLAFVAPRQNAPDVPTTWLQADQPRAIYTATGTDAAPTLLSDTDADSIAWREDSQLVAAGRGTGGSRLDLRLIRDAESTHLLDLPLRPANGYGLAWDIAHARLLIAEPTSTATPDFWLALLGLKGDE